MSVCVCVGAGAVYMSTEQQLFFPSENVQANPNRPALNATAPHLAYRQAESHSELFTKEPLQGLHLQRTKQTNGVMYRQHEVVFPLSELSLTLQNTLLLLTRNQSGKNTSLQQSSQRP